MRRFRSLSLAVVCTLLVLGAAQWSGAFPDRTPRVHALVGARVIPAPGEVLEDATIVLRDGIITAVGKVEPPADARIWDLQGLTVYAGLVEPFLDLSSGKKPDNKDKDKDKQKPTTSKGVRHPNARVHAESRVVESLQLSDKQLKPLRAIGFTTAHVVPTSGIFCGQSAVVDLHDGTPVEQIVRADVAQVVDFEHASWADKAPTYPSSLMGSVAVVRQTFLDAGWAADATERYASRKGGFEKPQSNLAWDALAPTLDKKSPMPVWIMTGDVLGTLRSAGLAQELQLHAVLVGNGEEYQHVNSIQAADYPVVLPVNYPKAPDVSDEDTVHRIELEALQHWENAPGNAAKLHEAGVAFAMTSHGLKKRSHYRKNIARAIEAGLPSEVALAAITTRPAEMLGVSQHYGTIAVGKVAQLTVTDGDLFGEKTKILEVWVNGDRYEIDDEKRDDIAQVQGTWQVVAASGGESSHEWTLEVKGNEWTLRGTLVDSQGDVAIARLQWERGALQLTTNHGETLLLEPAGKKELKGTWRQVDGTEMQVAATRPTDAADKTAGGAK